MKFLPFVPEARQQQLWGLWPSFQREARRLGVTKSEDDLWESFQLQAISAMDDVEALADQQLQASMKIFLAGKLAPHLRDQVQEQVGRELAGNSATIGANSMTNTEARPDAFTQFKTDQARLAAATARGEATLAAEQEAFRFENLPADRRAFRIEVATKASPDRERDPEVARMREEHARLVRQGR